MGTHLTTEAIVISIYGGTAWSNISGKFLIGANNTYKVNTTGGTSSITSVPSHTHSYSAPASHSHGVSSAYGLWHMGGADMRAKSINATTKWTANAHWTIKNDSSSYANMPGALALGGKTDNGNGSQSSTTGSAGNSSVSVLNPYYAVYIWIRTA